MKIEFRFTKVVDHEHPSETKSKGIHYCVQVLDLYLLSILEDIPIPSLELSLHY